MKHSQFIEEERYEDCDRCGERYYGEFINAYLHTEKHLGQGLKVCCPRDKKFSWEN